MAENNSITVDLYGAEYYAEDRLKQRSLHLDSLMRFITYGVDAFNGLDSSDRDYVLEAVQDLAWEVRRLTEMLAEAKQAA